MEDEHKDESPASWRLGLRKTGSYGALAEITATKEAQREKDTSGVMRSASSPRLSSTLDNKDKEKVGGLGKTPCNLAHRRSNEKDEILILHVELTESAGCPPAGEGQRDPAGLRGSHHPQETGQHVGHRREGEQVMIDPGEGSSISRGQFELQQAVV